MSDVKERVDLSASVTMTQEELQALLIGAVKQALKEQERHQRRRQSMGRPSVSNTSQLTDPVLSPRVPRRGRAFVGERFDLLEDENDENDDEVDDINDDEPVIHHSTASATSHRARTSLPTRTEEERRIIQKAMSNMPKPEKFSGTTDAEKDGVEQWVTILNHFLDGQFQGVDAPKERMIMVLQFLKGPALEWMQSVYAGQSDQTWEELQLLFIQHIRGSRATREVAREKMKRLAYGKGKAHDLLSYDAAFEELRVKLYPSSTNNKDMNERSAEDYKDGIRRGDPQLFKEMTRCLAIRPPEERLTLAACKKAASLAVEIISADKEVQKASHSRSHQWRSSQSFNSWPSTITVHNVRAQVQEGESEEETWERLEGEEQEEVNKMQTRPSNKLPGTKVTKTGRERRWGDHLTFDLRQQLLKLGKCWLCYQRGHVARECPDKDKGGERRQPTKEELNW